MMMFNIPKDLRFENIPNRKFSKTSDNIKFETDENIKRIQE